MTAIGVHNTPAKKRPCFDGTLLRNWRINVHIPTAGFGISRTNGKVRQARTARLSSRATQPAMKADAITRSGW
jgi:hypothetical protein